MENLNSQDLLARYRSGEESAADEIYDRYVRRLLALVRGRLSAKLERRIDPEDVLQSAYRSFFVHARDGDFVLERAGDLWRLLAAITLNKLYGQAEIHRAQRRDIHREVDLEADLSGSVPQAIDVEPTPGEAVEIAEQLHLAMQSLSADERTVFEQRLSGKTIEYIANELNRSQRTVRRMLQNVRDHLEQRLND